MYMFQGKKNIKCILILKNHYTTHNIKCILILSLYKFVFINIIKNNTQ